MKRFAPLVILVLMTVISSPAQAWQFPWNRKKADVVAGRANASADSAGLTSQTSAAATDPVSDVASEISDDPIVKLVDHVLNRVVQPIDVQATEQINDLPANQDRAAKQCVVWIASPDTRTKLEDLLSAGGILKQLSITGPPITPVGPLSVIAEARRVERSIESGSSALSLAAFEQKRAEFRKKRMLFREDFNLACAPFFNDVRGTAARASALLAGVK